MKYLFILLTTIALVSCKQEHNHEEGGHEHDEDSHEKIETPTVDYTIWTKKTELFVEFPVLVVGQKSRFAAHFTVLDKHQPVKEGTVTVSLIKGEKGIKHKVDAPASDGIFTPTLQPTSAGVFQLVFEITTPTLTDRISIDSIQVYTSNEEAIKANAEDENGAAITFLKEQAWKIDFQTQPTTKGEIYQVITTSGIWKEAPSDVSTIVATSNGVVSFAKTNLTEGSLVKKGQVLLTINSSGLTTNNLSTEIKKAKADFEQAKAEYERKKQLYTSKVVPKSEFESVEQKYEVAKSNYESLSSGYGVGGKQIIAPFNGYVKAITISNGEFAEQGTPLLKISANESSLLELGVSPEYASALKNIQNIWYQPQQGVWSNLKETKGSVLSVSKAVTQYQPLLTVFAKVKDAVEMPEGSFTSAQVLVGMPQKALLIPTNALLEDYGNYSVIVQLSGESFERRPVVIGRTNGNQVEIIKGLSIGEVVVTEGAYQVKMASMSGQVPAHGHAH